MDCQQVATRCQCDGPGTCKVTGRNVTASMHERCKSDGKYRLVMTDCWGKAEPVAQSEKPTTSRISLPCIHRSDGPMEFASCGCHVYDCEIHDRCVPWRKPKLKEGVKVCDECQDRKEQPPAKLLPDCTICITHWIRPKALAKLLASIRKYLPGVPIEMENTNGNVSAARNRLYGRVKTPFIIMMEDDFVVKPGTVKGLQEALEILNHDPTIAGVGGSTTEPKRGHVTWGHNFRRTGTACTIFASHRPVRTTSTGITYRPCDLVLNWGLFRRSLFERVPWDDDFPITEHKEYFWRASQAGNEFAFYNPMNIAHEHDYSNRHYNSNRRRHFYDLVFQRHGFRFIQKE